MLKKELEALVVDLEDKIVFLKKEVRNLEIKLEKADLKNPANRPKYTQHHYEADRKK